MGKVWALRLIFLDDPVNGEKMTVDGDFLSRLFLFDIPTLKEYGVSSP